MTKTIKLSTNIKVIARDLDGNITDVKEIANLITTVGLQMLRDALNNVATVADCMIKYVEVGTGSTAPALADVALDNFLFRKLMTSRSTPSTYTTKCTVYIAPGEAIGAIEEIGWWAGAACGAGEATGIMIARVLYTRNKTALESLQIERTDTITEG